MFDTDHRKIIHPTAFLQCNLGGKTRVLKELHTKLKESCPHCSVIYVSFGNFSPLEEWERQDLNAALCQRIAFSALRERIATTREEFQSFLYTFSVSKDQLLEWLGGDNNKPCILLVDEFRAPEVKDFAKISLSFFLNQNFLRPVDGRYFAIASHFAAPETESELSVLESVGVRTFRCIPMPLISSMEEAREKLDWPNMTVRQAFFRGRIPGLIWNTKEGNTTPQKFEERDQAISALSGKWTDDMVHRFLLSFINGSYSTVPDELLRLMSVINNDDDHNDNNDDGLEKIVWIPYHMVHVLDSIITNSTNSSSSQLISSNLRKSVETIQNLFYGFETGTTGKTDSWEALFLVTTMIRSTTGLSSTLLELDKGSTVSFNTHWKLNGLPFESMTTLEELFYGLIIPDNYPHVAIYYSSNVVAFDPYDLIIAVYDNDKTQRIFGYRLKGRGGGKMTKPIPNPMCYQSWIVEGDTLRQNTETTQNDNNNNDDGDGCWMLASEHDINLFLGCTGSTIASRAWRGD